MSQLRNPARAATIDNVVSLSARRDDRIRLDKAKRQLERIAKLDNATEIADEVTRLLADFLRPR